MRANRAAYPVRALCCNLGVSASGYYAWSRRSPSARARRDAALLEQIRLSHERSDGTYGARRIVEDLRDWGRRVGRKRVARLMRKAGIVGVSRRRGVRTTRRAEDGQPTPDLVQRQFTASTPNALWVADITYVLTWAGFLYLAIVLDAFSRRIVGWAMAGHLQTRLVLDALDTALTQRRPQGVIHHTDHGCQYTALAFGQRSQEMGVRPSHGTIGDAYDNALAESFFATLEGELLDRHRFHTQAEAA